MPVTSVSMAVTLVRLQSPVLSSEPDGAADGPGRDCATPEIRYRVTSMDADPSLPEQEVGRHADTGEGWTMTLSSIRNFIGGPVRPRVLHRDAVEPNRWILARLSCAPERAQRHADAAVVGQTPGSILRALSVPVRFGAPLAQAPNAMLAWTLRVRRTFPRWPADHVGEAVLEFLHRVCDVQ